MQLCQSHSTQGQTALFIFAINRVLFYDHFPFLARHPLLHVSLVNHCILAARTYIHAHEVNVEYTVVRMSWTLSVRSESCWMQVQSNVVPHLITNALNCVTVHFCSEQDAQNVSLLIMQTAMNSSFILRIHQFYYHNEESIINFLGVCNSCNNQVSLVSQIIHLGTT